MPSDLLHLSDDLLFASKVSAVAQANQLSAGTVRQLTDLLARCAAERPGCVIVDLQYPGLEIASLVTELHAAGVPRVIAYGSHVAADVLREARSAGCLAALPRSAFVQQIETDLVSWSRGQPPNSPS